MHLYYKLTLSVLTLKCSFLNQVILHQPTQSFHWLILIWVFKHVSIMVWMTILQLAFPFYLIFIATLLIITSHYSTTIQRLTVCRALPVLATLFLLSYNKILLTVSIVLFHYSKDYPPTMWTHYTGVVS